MDEQEIVMVPVPKHLLPVVFKALANAMEVVPESSDPPAGTPQGAEVDWTNPANFKRLRPALHPVSQALFDLTSAQPGKRITFGQVLSNVGCNPVEGRAQLSSLTKVIKRDFKVPKGKWPVEAPWDYKEDQMSYVMDEKTAAAWKASGK